MPLNNNLRDQLTHHPDCVAQFTWSRDLYPVQSLWMIEEVQGDVIRKPSSSGGIGPPRCWALLCPYLFTPSLQLRSTSFSSFTVIGSTQTKFGVRTASVRRQ